MHPNPVFHNTSQETALAFAAEHAFGIVAINGPETPLLAHVPFYIDGNTAYFHLMRSNPIARAAKDPLHAKLIVNGPHGYVSPDWYGVQDQVPTWNYVAVHLAGTIVPLPADDLRGLIDRLSDQFEAKLAPKPVWKSDKMDPDALSKMMRIIQPFKLDIDDVQSTYKLNQNKPDEARIAAAQAMAQSNIGSDTAHLAELMTHLPEKDTE